MRAPRVTTPLIVLMVGFGFSLAANILWTWPGGYVRILGGALASVALPATVHMFPLVPAGTRKARYLRNLVMSGIAVLAAVTTLVHASSLLIAHGEIPWLAWAYPVMTELLVVFAVLARRTPVPARKLSTGSTLKQRVSQSTAPPTETPAPLQADEVRSHRGQRSDRVAWLRAQNLGTWTEQVAAVEAEFRVSRSTARRVVEAAKSAEAS